MQRILWRLSLPPDVLGTLDWVSGVILVNEGSETFNRVDREGAVTEYEKQLVRTVTHEQFHYYQVLLTGYLYNHVNGLRTLVESCLAQAQGETRPDSFDAIVALFDELPARLPQSAFRPLIKRMAGIEEAGRHGLSVMHIVEAHATFLEFRYREYCDAPLMAQLFDTEPIPENYRHAWNVAREHLGLQAAFQWFSLICCLALCSSQPVLSFGRLVDALAAREETAPADSSLDVTDLVEACCGYYYMGSPLDTESLASVDFAASPGVPVWHYQASLAALRAAIANANPFDPYQFFLDPYSHLDNLADISSPTLVLNPFPTGGIPILPGRPNPEMGETNQGLMRAAALRQLLEHANSLADDPSLKAGFEQDMKDARQQCLEAARNGITVGYFNLGNIALEHRHPTAAQVWWSLGALSGDRTSRKALAIAHSEAAREQGDAIWASAATRTPRVDLADLVQMGMNVDEIDSDAADECFRLAALRGSIPGAWLYGSREVARDPVEGLFHLELAVQSVFENPESRLAEDLITELRAQWGRRTWRKRHAQARRRVRKLGPIAIPVGQGEIDPTIMPRLPDW